VRPRCDLSRLAPTLERIQPGDRREVGATGSTLMKAAKGVRGESGQGPRALTALCDRGQRAANVARSAALRREPPLRRPKWTNVRELVPAADGTTPRDHRGRLREALSSSARWRASGRTIPRTMQCRSTSRQHREEGRSRRGGERSRARRCRDALGEDTCANLIETSAAGVSESVSGPRVRRRFRPRSKR